MKTITEHFAVVLLIVLSMFLSACNDDDSFTKSSNNLLTFSIDTLSLDTVFSTVPSSMRDFWVYNKSGDGLRNINVRLKNGNQAGFRVNVDGAYLSSSSGYQVNDIEVRNNDSIRVMVELTSPVNYGDGPTYIDDYLVFTLESGVQQQVVLSAWSWDAELLTDVAYDSDYTLSSDKPIVVYGDMEVAQGATLTIAAGTTLYFHSGAGMTIEGTLLCEGTASQNVTLRGDRLDNMFDYLPYDYVSGQWEGLHFLEASYDNVLTYTDLHGSFDGIRVDSSSVSREKIRLENSTVHNCQGDGIASENACIVLHNTQISNTLGNCLRVDGGIVEINNCTIAQFYPFDSSRDIALRFTAETYPLTSFVCLNTLVTGYADDEILGEQGEDSTNDFIYYFSNCILRTPETEDADTIYLVNITYEEVEDTITGGVKNFKKIDTDNLRYDFHLSEVSKAIDAADPLTALSTDRDGRNRDSSPDIGAYECVLSTDEPD